MNPLQGLYLFGLELDRAFTKKIKLSRPVLSIGNIAVGGRAKTPLVIDICKRLKIEGYQPVVLTRGYSRKCKEAVWLLPETLAHVQNISVDKCGDEAVEIFLSAKVPVLISAKRSKQAEKFLKQYKDQKFIFILDDGFQHWKLERDADVVVVNDKDERDSLLPTGRLRESPLALKRADLVLHLGKDLHKKMELTLSAQGLDPSTCVAITTRAGSQKQYNDELNKHLGFQVKLHSYKDHLNTDDLERELSALAPGVEQLLMGMKEAVKLIAPADLLERKTFYPLKINDRGFQVYIVQLNLEWERETFYKLLQKKGIL